MKKTMFIIAIFAATLILFTASSTSAIDGRTGHSAPRFRLTTNHNEPFELEALQGRWVLLSFWASTDARSRINARYYSLIESNLNDKIGERQFCHVAVNLDSNERLYREIARHDKIDAKTQCFADGNRANSLIQQYHLDKGMNTFLIDPQGYVAAINPTEETILAMSNDMP